MNPEMREFLVHPDMKGRLARRGLAMVADNATVVGDVRLGADVGIWFGVTIRGDDSWIEIGDETNVQDNSCVHVDIGAPLRIGRGVTIGHGVIVHGVEIGDYVDRLVAPYFEAVAEWYGALRIGVRGGVLQEIIDRRLGDPFFGIFLNPGHQLHLDEWVNSPIWPGSDVVLRSGMCLQVDIIPATGTTYFTTNIEDGLALADEALRAELASRHPQMMARIQARRAFMADALGIKLHPDVLPLSNIPSYLPPFLLRPERVMTLA